MQVLKRSALDLMTETGFRKSEKRKKNLKIGSQKAQTQPSSPMKILQKQLKERESENFVPLELLEDAKYVSTKDMERAEQELKEFIRR